MHARVTSALQSPLGTAAALGMTWRPARSLPLAFSVERRIAVAEGGRNAFAAYAAGGGGPVPRVQGGVLDGFAQAGVVGEMGGAWGGERGGSVVGNRGVGG